jgi:hypothetical protein
MPYSSGPGGHTPPLPEVNFLMVEILTPKPYIKIEKASEMQQPSCKSKLFGQTGFLFSRYINVM